MKKPFRERYPIDNWVVSKNNVEVGDTIIYDCDATEEEVKAIVVGFSTSDQYIHCKRLKSKIVEVINIYNTIVYKIESVKKECTCGAKFTSNPSFHLNYCDEKDNYED